MANDNELYDDYMPSPLMTTVNGGTITLRVTVKEGKAATLASGSTYYMKTSQKSGGAVLVGSGGTVSGAQVTFLSCRGSLGGAIYNDQGTVNLDNPTFYGCTANSGGAIYNNYGTVNLTSGLFSSGFNSGNSGYGGAIFNIGGTVNVSGGTFVSNNILAGKSYTCRQGAAIYNISGGTMNISGAVFSGNTGQSGTIYASGGTINISDTVFCNNSGESGTIFLCGGKKGNDGFVSGAVVNLSNVVFSGNNIAIGAGIYNAMGEVNVTGGTFCGNTSTKQGAAIYHTMSGSVLRVSGAVFSGNTANSRGGALDVHNAGFVISGGTFLDNAAYQYGGGAISIKGAASSFYEFYGSNVFSGNYSLSAGTATTEVHSGGAIAVMEFQGINGTVNLDLYGTMDLMTETDTICLQHYANAPSGNILFNFDFTKEDTSGRAKLNDWSLVSISETGVNLGVTVQSGEIASYTIAGNAASFDDSITLTVGDTSVGELTFFNFIEYDNLIYRLNLTRDNSLVLNVYEKSGILAESTDRIDSVIRGSAVALWDDTTSYTAGAVYVVDDDYGVTELLIDNTGADGAEKTWVYGGVEYGEASTTKVSIDLVGGTIGAIMGGAYFNNTIGDVDVKIGGAAVAASVQTVYGAGQGIVSSGYGGATGSVKVTVASNGTVEKQLYGGACVVGEDYYSEYVDGDVQLDLYGGTLGSDVIGGARVFASNDTTATISGKITINIDGATFTGGTAACIYGAGWAVGDGTPSGNSDCLVGGYEKDVTINIFSDVEIGDENGRGIFGGALADNYAWAGTENGGNVNINVSGTATDKTVVHNVFGGGWAQGGGVSVVNGNVNISLNYAEADVIYGGGAHGNLTWSDVSGQTQIGEAYAGNGNVSIVIDNSNVMEVHAVGQVCESLDESNPLGDVVFGDASIQVSGDSQVSYLYGTDFYGNDGCTGSATLLLDDYAATIDENYKGFKALSGFDKVTVQDNTKAVLASDADVGAAAWTFDLTARTLAADQAVLTWENGTGFGSDSFSIRLNDTATAWTVCDLSGDDVKATAFDSVSFKLVIGGQSYDYTQGSDISVGAWTGWKLDYDETTGKLTFAQLA